MTILEKKVKKLVHDLLKEAEDRVPECMNSSDKDERYEEGAVDALNLSINHSRNNI